MKRFLLVAALAVLTQSAALGAGRQSDSIPPVPQSVLSDTSTVQAPTPAIDEEVGPLRQRVQQLPQALHRVLPPYKAGQAPGCAAAAPSCSTPAQTFKPTCTTAVETYKVQTPTCAAQAAPSCSMPVSSRRAQAPTCAAPGPAQGPSCAAEEACMPCDFDCCETRQIAPLKFLVKELVRKPVYGVQKAVSDAEARRLAALECRLNRESEKLAAKAYSLANKAEGTCPCDACAKQSLCRETVRYANQANAHALRRATLDVKRAENEAKVQSLRVKHAELFSN